MKKDQKLKTWVWDFAMKHKLLSQNDRVGIGASCGADSLLLIWLSHQFLCQGLIKELMVFHVNYKSRKEADFEEETLRKFCQKLGITFFSKDAFLERGQVDFESQARKFRYQFFSSFEHRYDKLMLGHHIDDSFEWYLMSQFRSSHSPAPLGIPVKRGKVIRLLHCLSSEQIRFMATLLKLPFLNDSSNKDLAFERNWVRWRCVYPIKKKYPNVLKNFVIRGNIEARKRGQSIFSESKVILKKEENLCFLYQISKKISSFEAQEESMLEAIKHLNKAGRGEVREQLQKIIKGNIKGRMGPYDLSNGVKCWSFSRVLIFTNGLGLEQINRYIVKTSQIPKDDFISNPQPFYTIKLKKQKEGMNQNPLIQDQINQAKRNDLSIKPFGYFFKKHFK